MLGFGIQTAFEIFLVVAVIWGIFNEDKLIVLERRLFSALRRRALRVVRARKVSSGFRVIEGGR